MANVPGRITFLTVSIKTMNIIRGPGVPWGTKCVNMWFIWLILPYSMKDNHNGKAKDKVMAICLVLVKTYGISPIVLLNIIVKINGIISAVNPLVDDNNLNSLWSVLVIEENIIIVRVLIIQYM